jgi:RHS repeat-associated protein
MDSQNGLPNPLAPELQHQVLVQPDIFTVDSQKQQPTSLFSVDEQLIKETLNQASQWKIVAEPFSNSVGEGGVNSWANSANAPDPITSSNAALLNSLLPKPQTSAAVSIAQYPVETIALSKAVAVSQIQEFLNRPDYLEQFKIAFGQDVERTKLDQILQDWQTEGHKLPEVRILSAQILGKASGGFDTVNNQIYLSSNLIDRGKLSEITSVIIEEFGHYLDSKIHPNGDAPGDEGEIFSKLVRGVDISASEYVTLINEDDSTTIILPNSQFSILNSQLNIEQAVTTNYAIKAEKTVSFNGSSDLDGNPLDLSDDALVYGGKGFTFNGNSILPVKYDASGNPVKNSQGKLVLVDKAVTVAAGYLQANVNGTGSKYAGLNPPQIVATETVLVPLFADIKQQELNRRIPAGTITTTFNISTNPINTAAQWATKFPPGGTVSAPKVVRVTGGGLNIPGTVNLSNYVIIVDSGDINFNGTGNLSNVTLVASNGNINLNAIQSDNLSALAAGTINHNSGARFGGNSLFANGTGNITFNGATKGITANDNLRVVSAGNITFNGAQSTRGSFVSAGDFIANGSTNIYGTVSSKQNITFNGATTFTYANILSYSDSNAPVILVNLVNDSGTSNSDKITNDGRISGTITDVSQIVAFKAGFDSKPVANFTDVLPYLTNGSFSFTKAQLETIYGGTIPDGIHTLNLIATDYYGNQSSVYPYTFNLDTTTPVPTLNLAATSDTGVVGDFRTKSALVTLTGKVEANAKVLLSGNPTPITADSLGNYTFANVTLAAGNNSFTVTATDSAGNQQTYTQIVYRTSPPTGVNLGTPQILENSANNTVVGGLNTSDPDGVDNYVYMLVNDAGGRFKLVGDKIQVANGNLLDFEANIQHQIQVRTTDSEGDSYLQTIAISVLNVNESPNNLLVLPTVILENIPNNTILGQITSTDPDVGDNFNYSLVAGTGDGDNAKFAIVGDKLVIKNSPDYEVQSSYTIRLKTIDAGGLSYEKQVTISISNVNEAPTILTLSNNTTAENSGLNGIIGTFTSIDPDFGDTRTYTLTSGLGDIDNSQFTILGDKLQLKPNPDFETKSSYQLRARVTDAGWLSYEKSFTVNISDVNEAPTNLTSDTSNINENTPVNSIVGTLTTTDPDLVDTATYTLINGNGDSDNSKFAISGNKLTINQSPDFETQSSYTIRLKTTDKGGLTYEKQLTIGVNNVNEAPTSLTLSNNSVAENIGLNGIIGTFASTDPDLGDTRAYSLINGLGDVDNSQFTIIGDKLQLNPNPNFEAKFTYQLRARVTDAGGLSYDRSFTVNISDINEAPTNLTSDTSNINENNLANSIIGNLTTTDPDLVDTASYTLVAGTGATDNSKFAIVGNKLQINQSPDFETQPSYSVRIRTTDKGGLTLDKVLTIGVKNINEAPTKLTLSNNSVAENIGLNGVIGTFTSIDPDLVDTRTYTLTSGLGDSDNSLFTIVGDKLQLKPNPDFETKSSYQLRARVTDAGGLSYEQSFTVNITDVNEAPTALNISNTTLAENVPGGTVVGNLTAIDPDINETQTFSLIAGTGDTNNSAFNIVGSQLIINNSPDFEAQNNYSLRVLVSDGGGLTFDRIININITDLNEAPTGMILSGNNIAENSSDNSTIGILTTIDQDSIDTANYTLTDDANGRFKLVGNQLKVANGSLLDFETNTQHQITILSTDTGGLSFSRQFTIGVTNVNEIPIDFSLSNNTITENTPIGGVIGNLNTIDPDFGDTHTYTLVNGVGSSDNSAFSIVNNQLKFLVSPNFETKSNYSLRVKTTDTGGLNIEKTLTVNITNINEAPTQLVLDTTSVAENSPIGTLVGKFTSTDPDLGDSHSYSLVTGNGSDDNPKFSIVNNELRLNISPDFETQSVYHLRVQTADAGGLTWTQELTVNILDLVENQAPTAIGLTNSSIAENSANNTLVARLNTTDPNSADTHTYLLLDNAGGRFKLVGDELRVANGSLLDFEAATSHQIRLRTTDNGTPNLAYERDLMIGVTNVNETPLFTSTPVLFANAGKPYSYRITTIDPDTGDTRQISTNQPLPSWLQLINNGDGTATLSGNPGTSDTGIFNIGLTVTDAAGLKSTQTFNLGVTTTLVEGTSFNKHLDIPVTIPATGGKISFKLNPLQFDGTDLNGINDALEVALVDAQGKSVVTPFQTGQDAFFNWTEGEPVAMGKGASYDPATGIVTLDLTGVTPGAANLVFRLINNDKDTTTTFTLTDLTLSPNSANPPVNPNSQFSILNSQLIPPTFFNTATDVSPSILADYHRTSFNAATKELDVNVALKNQGSYGLNGTLVVVVNHISDPSVSIKNADGFTPEGLAYYTFTTVNGKLDPSSVTGEKTLVFRNPNGVQFSYDLTVLAELNAAPVIKSLPGLEVIGGKQYQYQIKAEDLNGDSLTYKLLTAPSGMSIDPSTGLVNWNTSVGQIGNYQLAVEVSDGRGGITQQNYNLAVIDTPPNRPPVFTSNPVVDANVNSVYNYQALATDPDGDSLIYSLISAPAGMTVNANTGVLTWNPTGSQLGTFDVSLGVADNRGGIAQQQFKIRTGTAVGNHAPIITSNAVILATANQSYSYQVKAVDPDADLLVYSLIQAPQGMTIDRQTGLINWNPITTNPNSQQITINVEDNRGGRDTQIFNLDIFNSSLVGQIKGNVYQSKVTTGGESIPIRFTLTADNQFRYYYGKADGSQLTYVGKGTDWPALYNFQSILRPDDYLYVVSWNLGYSQMFIGEAKFADGTSLVTNRTNWQSIRSPKQYASFVQNNFPTTEISQQISTATWLTPQAGISRTANTVWGNRYSSLSPLTQFIDHESFNATTPYYYIYKTAEPVGRYYADQKNLGLADQLVYLDNNHNSIRDADETYTTTDTKGNYSFTVSPGTYDVKIDPLSNWVKSSASQSSYQVTLTGNSTIDNRNFILAAAQGRTIGQSGNTAPVFQTNPVIKAVVGENFRYQAKALDAEGDKFTYDLVVKPAGMVVDPVTGLINWRPQVDLVGSQSIILRVTDDLGAVTLQSFQIQVANANQLPIFTNSDPSSNPSLGNPYQYQFSANDPDGGSVTFTLDAPDINAKIDPNTGLFTWTPTNDGSFPFVVTATDSQGGRTSFPFALLVNSGSNLAPFIASTPRKQTAIGQTYVYQIAATDPNSDPLTYSLINPPAGMSVNNQGLLTWTPTAAQLGQSAIQIQVSDGRGGITTQQFGLDVVNFGNLVNHSPEITSIPTFTTNLTKTYSYQLSGADSDNDTLIWSLDTAPTGMVIDSKTGILKWNPTSTQLGTHTVAVRLTDAYGLYVGQEYTLKVNGVNTPPQIQSTPNTISGVNSAYKYQIKAIDLEGDALKYTLGRRPSGMIVNSDTGLITWTPTTLQIGTQIIDVLVTDAQGAVTTQTYNLVVGSTPINQAPTITSQPKFTADINTKYQYQIVATDPENQQLTYALTTAPAGMVIDTNTGLITWNNPTLGTTNIQITATDTSGAVAAQGYTLTGKQNQAPVINSTPTTQIIVGNTYRYDVIAKDSDNDALTYSLDTAATTAGVTIDKLGRMNWKPTTANIGTQPVTITVSDTNGAIATQTYNLQILADNIAPKINLVRSTNIANIGETISFQIQATDNVGIKSKQLLINNQAVSLDSNGVGRYKITTTGIITATAIVTDINGNTSNANTTVITLDPTDIEAPNVSLDLSGILNGIITGSTEIKGTVTDTNLDYYTLEVARLGTNNWQEVFRGQTSVTNGILGKFDPSQLENDTYRVRLSAFDTNGRGSNIEDEINVTGDLKLGNFKLSFTDISIPVTGIPITLTRTYDSLTTNTKDDFGYGWRMEFRDTDLRTSLKADPYYQELDYRTVGFNFGTRIYITLPGGRREGFTFQPKQVQGALGGLTGGRWYYPSFVADKGVKSTLTVPGGEIKANVNVDSVNAGTSSGNPNGILMEKDGKLFNLAGRPYVPQDDGFGNRYLLTTKDGTQYEINATTGDLESVKDTNGNVLTYSDTEIKSSTGVSVKFERDNQGRIVSVTDPLGQKVKYEYDAKGDLVSVTDRDGNTTGFQYNATRSHYLDKIVDPLGREAVKTEYDELGRLKKTANSSGNGVEFVYNPANSLETVKDALGNPTTYEYDTRGNIVTEVDAVGKVTKRAYDDDNRMLSETVISERSGAIGFTTTYTYDREGNKVSETDALRNTTYYSYGEKGRLLTSTDALGRTTINAFDGNGNLISTKDAKGQTISFSYSSGGKLLSMTDIVGKTSSSYTYDVNGNLASATDILGHVINYNHDAQGHLLSETQKDGTRILTNRYTYDNQGNQLTSTDALNHTTTYTYNGLGQQVAVTDALGRVTRMVYDSNGRLIETILPDATPNDLTDNPRTRTQYDAMGWEVATIDEAGKITRMVYDAVGRLIETIEPDDTPNNFTDNPRTKTEHYSDGLVKANIDQLGHRTEYRYDALGRLIAVIYADNTPNDLSDNPISQTVYNAVGQVSQSIDPLGRVTKYIYDDLGRLTTTKFADGSETITEYDKIGRKIAAVDQNSNRTEYRYDDLGRLLGVVDALKNYTTYSYDEMGWLLSMTDAEQHTTNYEYDDLGRRTATVMPLSQRSTTSYDAVGNLITSTDFNGRTTSFSYDVQNRMTDKLFQDSSKVTYSYTIDGLLDITTMFGSNGQVSGVYDQDYDVRNQLIKRTDTIDGVSLAVSHTYDLAGNRTSVSTPTNTTYYTYDERNRLKTVTNNASGTTRYDYNVNSNLVQTLFANGVVENRNYDVLNRLLDLVNKKSDGTTLSGYHYTLDNVGNRTKVTEANGRTVDYTYDKLHQLVSETITDLVNGNHLTTFTYDRVSNILTQAQDAVTTVYSYDANDRLLSEKVNAQPVITYTYDNNGSTLTKSELNKLTQYTWNDDKRLIGATITDNNGGTQQLGYRYDDNGIRVSSIVNGDTTRYLLDTVRAYAQVLSEYQGNNVTPTVSYVYGRDLISQTRAGNSDYYLVDGLGSKRVLTDSQGNVTNAYDYEAFGKLLNSAGNGNNSYLFAGEQFDKGLGDYYLRDRFYNSKNGRFTRQDTYLGNLQSPLSLNKYIYGYNNPITLSDPTGFAPGDEFYKNLDKIGKEVHRQVGLHFVSFNPLERRSNITIKRILREADGITYNGIYHRARPDLINYTEHGIYEIKSNSKRAEGYLELIEYLAVLNLAPGSKPAWNDGSLYVYTPIFIPFPQYNKVAVVEPSIFGVVVYHLKDLRNGNDKSDIIDTDLVLSTIGSANMEYVTYGLAFLIAGIALRSSLGAFA